MQMSDNEYPMLKVPSLSKVRKKLLIISVVIPVRSRPRPKHIKFIINASFRNSHIT